LTKVEAKAADLRLPNYFLIAELVSYLSLLQILQIEWEWVNFLTINCSAFKAYSALLRIESVSAVSYNKEQVDLVFFITCPIAMKTMPKTMAK
jgi:hypothetical protein